MPGYEPDAPVFETGGCGSWKKRNVMQKLKTCLAGDRDGAPAR
jgi:hypothetical protein